MCILGDSVPRECRNEAQAAAHSFGIVRFLGKPYVLKKLFVSYRRLLHNIRHP